MLRQHLTEQEVAADQHWLNPEMEGQGASYAWPVAQLLGGVYQAWDESPHCVDELEKRLLARQEPMEALGHSRGEADGRARIAAFFTSEERRVGKECVSTCRSWRWLY